MNSLAEYGASWRYCGYMSSGHYILQYVGLQYMCYTLKHKKRDTLVI